MITIQDIKDWSKPHPATSYKNYGGEEPRMSVFGTPKFKFSIVGGASGLYGDFKNTFEVAIIDEDGKFVTRYILGGNNDVVGWMTGEELEKLVNSILRKENVVVGR
jgi:hypothetical protein